MSSIVAMLNQGQAGDLCINTVAARLFKKKYPKKKLWMFMNKKYVDLEPLFLNHPHIDGIVLLDGYDNFPTEQDKSKLTKMQEACPLLEIGNPMPKQDRRFPSQLHQCQAVCTMNGFSDEDLELLNGDYSCYLDRWFEIEQYKNCIAFAPFAGWYNPKNSKKLSVERAQTIVDFLVEDLNYTVLQVGGFDEPHLNNTKKFDTNYFDSMRNILSCQLLLTTDTWCAWYASAYKFNTIGLYSNIGYDGDTIKNIQPVNPRAEYLVADHVDNISLNDLLTVLTEPNKLDL